MFTRKLTFRCRPSTVRGILDLFSKGLTEEIIDLLRQMNVFQFTRMPPFQQETPLTIEILSCWDIKSQTFYIGGKNLAFTPDEVAMIIGMPNRGDEVIWSTKSGGKYTSIDIRNRLEKHIITSTDSFVKLYLQFLITNLFFPYHNYKVPEELYKYGSRIDIFSKFNWPEAIWRVLVSQFDTLARKFVTKKPLGYMSGFVTILMIWFFEHCDVITPSSKTATPRMMRWTKYAFWNTKRCVDMFTTLEPHQVSEMFQGVLEEELGLVATSYDVFAPSPTSTVLPKSSKKSTERTRKRSLSPAQSESSHPSESTQPFESTHHSESTNPTESTDSPESTHPIESIIPPSPSPRSPTNVDIFNSLQILESKFEEGFNKFDQVVNNKMNSLKERINDLDRRFKFLEKNDQVTPTPLPSLIEHIKSRQGRKWKFRNSPFISDQRKRPRQKKEKEKANIRVSKEAKGHHEMKRSFPWEEAVTISDSDSEEDKQDRAKRDKKDCSSENLKDITSEGTLIRMAGMYQEYMKRIPIPTFSGSIVPFTSWEGLAKSLKQLYGQPLHYLTNALLKQWDRERFGSDNEHQPLDAVVHPVKAQTLIWLTEELHRLTASPYHLAKLWACDPMYHSQIDPFLSY